MKEKELPSELCLEVLRRLQKAGVLQELLLIGSWCVFFYENYFHEKGFLSPLRTRDVDFLVPRRGNAPVRPVPIKALGVNAHAMRFKGVRGRCCHSAFPVERPNRFVSPNSARAGRLRSFYS